MMGWLKVSEYEAENFEQGIVFAEGWREPCLATYQAACTTDGRGNDVSTATGWLLSSVAAFYEDFGYFDDWEIKYYGVGAAEYVIPLKNLELPINKEDTS